jgi:hypothetical protein
VSVVLVKFHQSSAETTPFVVEPARRRNKDAKACEGLRHLAILACPTDVDKRLE